MDAIDRKQQQRDLLLNFAHLLDHLFMLIFATAAALSLTREWGMAYKDLLPYAIGGAMAFGGGSIPAGWLADRWSRHGTMVLFFIGIGLSAIATSFANSPLQIAVGLTAIGLFAAIYHPVGIAMLVAKTKTLGKTLGVNGVWGNLGLAFAALITGAVIDWWNWRAAFWIPGLISIAAGIWFWTLWPADEAKPTGKKVVPAGIDRNTMVRVFCVMLVAVIFNSIIFNSATISMPKVFDERLSALTNTALGIGMLVCFTYVIAAMAQLMVGWLIDRYPIRPVFIGIVAMQVPLLFLAANASDWALLIFAVGMMFAVFGQIPINDAMVTRYTAEEWRARAFGVRYVVSFTAAACAYSLISATQSAGGNGFATLFTALSACAALILLASFFFPGEKPRPA